MPSAGSTVPSTRSAGQLDDEDQQRGQGEHVDQDVEGEAEEGVGARPGPPRDLELSSCRRTVLRRRTVVRFMIRLLGGVGSGRRGGGCGGSAREEGGRVGDPAEDPALGGDHVQPDALELREVGPDAVRRGRGTSYPRSLASRTVVCTHTSVVTPVTIRLGDLVRRQAPPAGRWRRRPLAGLVDNDLAGQRGKLVDDVVAVLAADQDPAVRARGRRSEGTASPAGAWRPAGPTGPAGGPPGCG